MGAGQSKAEGLDEKVYENNVPVEFSQSIVNYLADNLTSVETSSERQSVLDAQIRSKLKAEISRLREEEESLKQMLASTLEKDNIDKERGMAGEENAGEVGAVKDSNILLADLEEVRQKVERYQSKRGMDEYLEAENVKDALISCYRNNKATPLDCWREVDRFRATVAKIEEKFIYSNTQSQRT